MAEDARALLDHLDIERADVMGYSMGARITAFLAINHAERVRSAIIGGLGIKLMEGQSGPMTEAIVAALEAPSLADVTDPTGRAFRSFAEQTKSDLSALAACMASPRERIEPRDRWPASRRRCWWRLEPRMTWRVLAEALAAVIPGARCAGDPRPRPHAGGRRPGLQGRGGGLS